MKKYINEIMEEKAKAIREFNQQFKLSLELYKELIPMIEPIIERNRAWFDVGYYGEIGLSLIIHGKTLTVSTFTDSNLSGWYIVSKDFKFSFFKEYPIPNEVIEVLQLFDTNNTEALSNHKNRRNP